MTFRTWKEPINLTKMTTVPVAFVIQLTGKLRPASIPNGLGKAMVFQHPFNMQVLNNDKLVDFDKLAAQLMKKVLPLVGYLFVLSRNIQACFLPALATLLSSGQAPIQSGKAAFGLTEILGSGESLSIGRNRKILQAQVKADLTAFVGWLINLLLYQNRGEILTALGFRYGKVFHFAFNGAVQDDSNPTYLGDNNLSPFDPKPLRESASLFAVLLFESWKLSTLVEKVVVSSVQVPKSLLQGLGLSLTKPIVSSLLFKFGQSQSRIMIAQTLSSIGIIVDSLAQKVVINKTSCPKLLCELGPLLGIWINSITESTSYQHTYNIPYIFVKSKLVWRNSDG